MNDFRQCDDCREDIAALVLGELDPPAAESLNRHIQDCERCRDFREALAAQEAELRSTFDVMARGVGRVEQLAERFDESASTPTIRAASPLRRLIGGVRTMRPSRKILAAAAAIALTFTGLASWLMPGRTAPGLAFATVVEQIRVFRPYSCLYTWEHEGKAPYSYRLMRPDLSRRREVRPNGTILVFDLSQQPVRMLTLNPGAKSAVETTLLNTAPTQDPDFLRMVAGMAGRDVEDLGRKEIDGRSAQGFHRPDTVNDLTVWADPKTGLPIRIELVQPALSRRLTLNEFQFDVAFDESLFSTTAPQGYTVRKVEEDGINPTEQDLTEGLRVIATLFGGHFPATLTNQAIEKALTDAAPSTATAGQPSALPSAEETKTMRLKAERALRYIEILKHFHQVSDLRYTGDGVALGDAATPVLRWKPKTSETYRVVYGDLSVRDVRPEDLPMPQQTGVERPPPEVLAQARVFRPYSCLCTWEHKGKIPESHREMHMSLSRRREEYPSGEILIVDMSQRTVRMLTLQPNQKSAHERTGSNRGPAQDPDVFRMTADLQDGTTEDLGMKQVDGRLAHGFHKLDPVNDLIVWADPATGLPIRMELAQPSASRRLIMSDFDFDPKLDESLFSTTAPAGYTVTKEAK